MPTFFSTLIFLSGFIFFTPIFATPSDHYPVIWTSEIKLNNIKDIPKLFAKNDYAGSTIYYVNDQNQNAIVKSCNQYFTLSKEGYYPRDNYGIADEGFFRKNCDSLLALSKAQPAKYSYLRNFNLKNDYQQLPAELIFPSLGDEDAPKGDLKAAFPDTTIEKSDQNSITLVSKKAAARTVIELLAWGDFNHDGYDDALVFIANYVTGGGTYHSYSIALLTKKSATTPIEVGKLP